MGRNSKKQLPCPNPLFERLLQEWRDEARQKGIKLQHAYQKALSSIKKYPLPLQSGQEAMILEGIGESIAKKLDEALAQQPSTGFSASDVVDVEHHVHSSQGMSSHNTATSSDDSRKTKKDSSKKKKQAGPKEYVPGYRTGAYALLLTVYRDSQRPSNKGFMTRETLQREAQSLSDKSFTLPDPGSRYTAWSSMSTLTKKGFIIKTSNPAKYSITPEGCRLAEKLQHVGADPSSSSSAVGFRLAVGSSSTSVNAVGRSESDSENDDAAVPPYPSLSLKQPLSDRDDPSKYTAVVETHIQSAVRIDVENDASTKISDDQHSSPEFVLKPGSFDVVLCVDFIETTGGAQRSRKDALVKELTNNGVDFDVRKLQVGDFAWVAREKTRPVPGQLSLPVGRELVLDYIIERKRMDDLNHSIIDGRFREQKFRLKNCGLKHPIYLVENFGSAQHLSLPEATLEQAIVNTQVADGFFIKRTRDTKESVAYLTLMTRFIQSFYMGKTLIACPREKLERLDTGPPSCDVISRDVNLMTYQEFSKETIKNKVITVLEMFGKHLMQISGMSADKAVVVLETYPTPRRLLEAYDREPTTVQKERMLSTLKYGQAQRSFGPALSKLVYQVYCTKNWPS